MRLDGTLRLQDFQTVRNWSCYHIYIELRSLLILESLLYLWAKPLAFALSLWILIKFCEGGSVVPPFYSWGSKRGQATCPHFTAVEQQAELEPRAGRNPEPTGFTTLPLCRAVNGNVFCCFFLSVIIQEPLATCGYWSTWNVGSGVKEPNVEFYFIVIKFK